MPDLLITDVADTAFWIAHIRAEESARPDALFHDPLAARLAGDRGGAIARSIPWNAYVEWSVALRTVIIDRFVLEAVASDCDRILNLGAGLDTRPYRLGLPAGLDWIEADQAGVIAYKEQVLAGETPRCRLRRHAVDLADPAARAAFLDRAVDGARRCLVLTEGVVPYLEEADVAALGRDLAARPAIQAWIVDYNSPLMMKLRARQKGVQERMKNAPFRFQPADWEGFFTGLGWTVGEMRYYFQEGRRLGRALPVPWWRRAGASLMGFFASKAKREAFRRFAGYARLERA
jgi:methyltransferase (TIGR00027 family)